MQQAKPRCQNLRTRGRCSNYALRAALLALTPTPPPPSSLNPRAPMRLSALISVFPLSRQFTGVRRIPGAPGAPTDHRGDALFWLWGLRRLPELCLAQGGGG